jgi:hypothetical protein
MEIIAKKDFTIDDKQYEKGDIVKVNKNNIDYIWKLNEKGFIEPITVKDINKLYNEILNSKKKELKEDIVENKEEE